MVETFAIFVTFAVHKEWAHCWRKIYGAGHARNKSLYAVESMAVEAMFAMASGTGKKANAAACIRSLKWFGNKWARFPFGKLLATGPVSSVAACLVAATLKRVQKGNADESYRLTVAP